MNYKAFPFGQFTWYIRSSCTMTSGKNLPFLNAEKTYNRPMTNNVRIVL